MDFFFFEESAMGAFGSDECMMAATVVASLLLCIILHLMALLVLLPNGQMRPSSNRAASVSFKSPSDCHFMEDVKEYRPKLERGGVYSSVGQCGVGASCQLYLCWSVWIWSLGTLMCSEVSGELTCLGKTNKQTNKRLSLAPKLRGCYATYTRLLAHMLSIATF